MIWLVCDKMGSKKERAPTGYKAPLLLVGDNKSRDIFEGKNSRNDRFQGKEYSGCFFIILE